MRRIGIISLVCATLMLAGCGGSGYIGEKEFDHKLNDGRTVHCVKFGLGNQASISCDWPNAK